MKTVHRRIPAFLLALGLMLPAAMSSAAAQISPGPLARPHQALAGARNCLSCHGTRRDAMDAACLACHKEIAFLRAERRGTHGRETQTRCATCHPDHAGAEFNLTGWNADSLRRFDHQRAGWTLEGQHRETKCEDCHAPSLRTGRATALAPKGSLAQKWTGLETSCASCHEDVHKRSVGTDCADCHDSDDWVPARRFDHDRTDYPLTGRHATVDCAQCHKAKPRPPPPRESTLVPEFAPIAVTQCSACHQDPHGGRLGAACADCHLTTGFTERKPGSFNHDRTRYRLEGRHATVACTACHGPAGRRTNPGYASCADCHADRHQGTATLAGRPVDCAACHDTRSFQPATLTVAQHADTRYPLEGRHAAVACAACHRPQPDGSLERPGFSACATCHVDPHGEQLATLDAGMACERCHAVAGWATSTYPVGDHAATGLALEGRHRVVPCGDCHTETRGWPAEGSASATAIGDAKVRFRLGGNACATCHADPHVSDTAGTRLPECSRCHGAEAFRPATVSSATHEQLGYALLGAHRAVPCVACHDQLADRAAAGPALVRHAPPPPLDLRIAGQACVACHETPHGDQFAARDGEDCAGCHSESAFVPADRFDHTRDAAFSLEGAHARVACAQCHSSEPEPSGGVRTRWKPVSTKCEDCHDRGAE